MGDNRNDIEAESDNFSISDSKRAKIDELVNSAKIKEYNETLAYEMGSTILKSMIYITLKQEGKSEEEIENFILTDKFAKAVRQNTQSTFSIDEYYETYSFLEESEIEEYSAFYSTEYGRLFLSNNMAMLKRISDFLFSLAGEKLGHGVEQLINGNQ